MFNTGEIAKILEGSIAGPLNETELNSVMIDSRLVDQPENTLFVCLDGARRNGHDFIPALYDQGVRNFVVTKQDISPPENATYYVVSNGISALQKLAKAYRKKLTMPVIGITGSNGKTIVKEWLFQLLSPRYNVSKSPGSFNSQIGVALSILSIDRKSEVAIVEAGISTVGEMKSLFEMIRPTYGIFTNLGDAHDAGFNNRQEKFEEKKLLFQDCQWWIGHDLLAKEDSYANWSLDGNQSPKVDWQNSNIIIDGESWASPFSDSASMENLTHCIIFCKRYDPTLMEGLQSRISSLERVEMRMDVRLGIRGNKIISDYYNLDLQSLLNVLELSQQVGANLPMTLVLSDFIDQPQSEGYYSAIVEKLQRSHLGHIVFIGPSWLNFKDLTSRLKATCEHWPTTEAFIQSRNFVKWQRRLIILKGARKFAFENIEKHLVRPVYGTRLEIDLSALRHNWLTFDRLIGPGMKKMVMVKASAYGSGSIELAKFYQDNKVDYLGVAYANEAVELRESGVTIPVMIMNAEAPSLPLLTTYDLEPEVHGISQLEGFLSEMRDDDELKIHIKCESGMHRLGFELHEIPALLKLLRQHEDQIKVVSIFSHLSAAEDPTADDYSRRQIATFSRMYDEISQGLSQHPLKHIANSAATIRFPDAHFDMVRLGIALYGAGIQHEVMAQLRPVHALKTYIIQVKRREKGDLIGYGMEGRIKRPSRIATIPLGYADGIPRHMGNGKLKVCINGQMASSVGRICMDMTMIDVTDIEDCQANTEVEVFGSHISLDQFAEQAETIPYEVLVNLGKRVERVITQG